MAELRISVALVTRNRSEALKRCLESWRSQTVAPFEIVISDDSDEECATQIKELAAQFNCVYVKGPRQGLYANRNNASLYCKGTHILSGDDDHTHPINYIEAILNIVKSNPNQVWIFTERHPSSMDEPLVCPAELTLTNRIRTPPNPFDCAAIADGSSVYPRQIFDQGLRYDEAYPFGNMWYLWGRVLKKNAWKISFSDKTFIWHYALTDGREYDATFLKKQIECNLYVYFVNALWINPSWRAKLWSFYYLIKSFILPSSVIGYRVHTRIDIQQIMRLLRLVFDSKTKYSTSVFVDK